jgi:protoporphyrinogen IX oxidase
MLWIKCFHVLGVMAWMTGIFYLPRIFVHYAEGRTAGEDVRRLVTMATRLYAFMTIMALVAMAMGIWLWQRTGYTGLWLRWKLVLVLGLIGYHLACRWLLQRVRSGGALPGSVALRWFNECSLLLVLPIIALAIIKPSG